jgi:hypothetical protein
MVSEGGYFDAREQLEGSVVIPVTAFSKITKNDKAELIVYLLREWPTDWSKYPKQLYSISSSVYNFRMDITKQVAGLLQ